MKFKNLNAKQLGFRTEFVTHPNDRIVYWYPSHQKRAVMQLQRGLQHIDLIVEVRDARLPFTSVNPEFDTVFATHQHSSKLVVYNKADLANRNMSQVAAKILKQRMGESSPILFTSCGSNNKSHLQNDASVKHILDYAASRCRNNPQQYPYLTMIVVGIPNVGKSTLINALRRIGVQKGKVTQVGQFAGVTTAIQTRVKIHDEPPIYLVDTPGILNPHVINPLQSLKVSLTGGTSDKLTEQIHVADYLLFRLNNSSNIQSYPEILGITEPSDDINYVLSSIAIAKNWYLRETSRVLRLIRSNTDPYKDSSSNNTNKNDDRLDLERAAKWFIDTYRCGSFRPMTLDECTTDALHAHLSH